MVADALRLEDLLESVADGRDVDWDAVEAVASEAQRPIVRNLRLVARIAEVHRTVPDDHVRDNVVPDGQVPDAEALARTAPNDAATRWGHLSLLGRIGEGAFGEVYRAHDAWLDRHVALKLLKPDVAGPARLVAEARALARVRHPNVVTVHGADMHDGRVGLWMELVHGRTLSAIVASDGPFSAEEAAVIGREVCRAVAAVHAAGLVHRDIKAQNVMREAGGRLVLMDFGAGRTPLYAAPELILDDGDATAASDIYAIGVLLHFLVTGSYPVQGSSMEALREAHAAGSRRSLRDARPDLADEFVTVVERALSPRPADRFETAGEMARALGAGERSRGWRHFAGWTMRKRTTAAAALVGAALLAAAVWLWPGMAARPARTGAPLVVAVLPLDGPGTEGYFADGMTDALIQELSALESIRVISRTSSMQFKGSRQTARQIADALGADVILEGAVVRAGSDVRVNIRLIHAGTDTPVWSRGFDRSMHSVIALQRDIAKAVADDLPVVVTPAAAERWADYQRVNPRAYDAYLRGVAALNERTRDGMLRSIELFSEALKLDPRSAPVQAGVARAHAQLAITYNASSRANTQQARRAAQAALQLNPQEAEAHATLAEVAFFADWDWNGAESAYRKALALNPSLHFARERYAMFLAARQRLEEALTHVAEARRLDPVSLDVAVTQAGLLRYARRYPEAIDRYRGVLLKDPRHVVANFGLGRSLVATGKWDEALEHFRRVLEREPGRTAIAGEMAQAHAGAGRRTEAVEILRGLEQENRDGRPIDPETFGYVQASLGNRDQAFDWLTRAVETRSTRILWLAVDSRLDPLRSDPRFRTLLRRLSL
jgi:TolB-like protein/Tfp pilus assembly protein PilF/tRNA A-37 threonylcarbamoyl transferase component Bud32